MATITSDYLGLFQSKPLLAVRLSRTEHGLVSLPPEMKLDHTRKLRRFARGLISQEARGDEPRKKGDHPTFRVCDKLHGLLARLTGEAGYRALLLRALTLAKAERPWLGRLEVKPNGTIEYPRNKEAAPTGQEAVKGELALVTHLLDLLILFIGTPLTLRVLRSGWLSVNGQDLNFGKDESL